MENANGVIKKLTSAERSYYTAAEVREAIMELHLEHPMLLVTGEDMQQRSVVQMGSYTL